MRSLCSMSQLCESRDFIPFRHQSELHKQTDVLLREQSCSHFKCIIAAYLVNPPQRLDADGVPRLYFLIVAEKKLTPHIYLAAQINGSFTFSFGSICFPRSRLYSPPYQLLSLFRREFFASLSPLSPFAFCRLWIELDELDEWLASVPAFSAAMN